MLDYILETASFLPHGFCLLWRPDLVALHVGSDIAIGLAYFSIPIAILTYLRHKSDFQCRSTAYLFIAFITLCGLGHFAGAAMLWFPYYGLDGLIKAVTGVVSIVTAVKLWPLLPKVLAIPSPKLLAETNRQLETEIVERSAVEVQLRQTLDELARTERRARLAVEAGDIGTWEWDLMTSMMTRSSQCLALFGHPLDESPTTDAFFRCLHPDDRERVEHEVEVALVTRAWRSEFRGILPDGTVQWFDCRSSVLYEKIAGEFRPSRLMGTLMNITQKIEAAKIIQASLTEKETLLREIHHRVKNNLQSLLALLQMEGRQVQDRALVSRFDNMRSRIQVMAGIHENLYTSESLSAVNMGRQISSLCENLGQLGSRPHHIEIVADTEYLCCSIDVAVPLGVLANEIIINAVKHAFPDDRPGRIEVSFRQGWNGVALTVRDNGIGDTGHRGNGIGKELIAALADQLKAEVSVDAASGTTVHIVLPADDFKPCPAEAIKLPTSSMAVSQAFASGIGQPGVAS